MMLSSHVCDAAHQTALNMSTLPSTEMPAAPDALSLVSARPSATLVLASLASEAGLRAQLASILPTCRRSGTELIVVRAGSARQLQALGALYPEARFIAAPPDAAPAQMRTLGARWARGHMLLFTSDLADADMSWADTLTRAPLGFRA